MDWNAILNSIVSWATNTGVKIIIALVALLISFKIVKWICKKIEKAGEKKNADKTVMKTLAYATGIALRVVVIVSLVGYLGIDTSAITALIASFGVCIGLAVNGALSNVAGGVLILVTRPFKVDDFIEAQGISGVVADIHMTSTKIVTGDNKVIYIPNGSLANGNIINYSEKDTRRVDFDFSIAYNADSDKAKAIITDILTSHELVLKDNEPFVKIAAHGESAIVIKARVWTKSADYWTVNFDVLEAVKKEFDKNGIEIPFNQIDVHIKNS